MPNEPHQPHDKLFKGAFGQTENAIAFFRAYLPEDQIRHLDLSRLELVSGSFIDAALLSFESDLLFFLPPREGDEGGVFFYLLFEHQAQTDPWMPFRLLWYMLSIWRRHRAEHPESQALPVILPIVLAQSSTGWRGPRDFKSLFPLPEEVTESFAAFIPDFTFALIELAAMPFDKIIGTPMGVLALRLLKTSPEGEAMENAVLDRVLVEQVSLDDWHLLFNYLVLVGNIDKERFARKLSELHSPRIQRLHMTLAEQYREEGRREVLAKQFQEEGFRKGVLIGQIQLMLKLAKHAEVSEVELQSRSLGELQQMAGELENLLPH